jgi:photosynthetic reaction center cytochrome c subunit
MNTITRSSVVMLALGVVALTTGCEQPPPESIQRGFRGVGMEENYNPRILERQWLANQAPAPTPPAAGVGPAASQVFKNVQVLGSLSVDEFTRLMTAITSWVSPEQGCVYCHKPGEDFSSDTLYTKVVSRRMLQMTRTINADWKSHVADTGVTCYTCHRGQPIPANVWFENPGPQTASGAAGNRAGQNTPAPQVALASLPYDPFTPFLKEKRDIRVIPTTALPEGNRQSIKQTEWTYGLMMHFSQALGVNCTYCHNSRSFFEWDGSTPQRATAWYGIHMARTVNDRYLVPLRDQYPPTQLGPLGDAPKANCATCHQGVYKPLFGAAMAKDYPGLTGAAKAAHAAAATPAAVPAPAQQSPVEGTVVLFFAVASFELPTDGSASLDPVIGALKANPAAKAKISGYHSATGNLAQNQELAKKRAIAVRDALKTAGVEENRLVLDKPQKTEANVAGEERFARRVVVKVE